jgi:hypothetical protein
LQRISNIFPYRIDNNRPFVLRAGVLITNSRTLSPSPNYSRLANAFEKQSRRAKYDRITPPRVGQDIGEMSGKISLRALHDAATRLTY